MVIETMDETTAKTIEVTEMVNRERRNQRRQFNPNNEDIYVMRVDEKREYIALRKMVGAMEKDKELSHERGFTMLKHKAPFLKQRMRAEADIKSSGVLDKFQYLDPDMVDEDGIPVRRYFTKGEIFLATERVAKIMAQQKFASIMPNWKNRVDEETDMTRFDWAGRNEVISDDDGRLIGKYKDRYAVIKQDAFTLAELIGKLESKIAELEGKRR